MKYIYVWIMVGILFGIYKEQMRHFLSSSKFQDIQKEKLIKAKELKYKAADKAIFGALVFSVLGFFMISYAPEMWQLYILSNIFLFFMYFC